MTKLSNIFSFTIIFIAVLDIWNTDILEKQENKTTLKVVSQDYTIPHKKLIRDLILVFILHKQSPPPGRKCYLYQVYIFSKQKMLCNAA